MTRGVTEAAQALVLQLSGVIHRLDGQAYSSTLSALNALTAALAAEPGAAEGQTHREFEPGTIRICPMRDGPCRHGLYCPFVGDGYHGYPCKEGWNGHRAAPHQSGESGK